MHKRPAVTLNIVFTIAFTFCLLLIAAQPALADGVIIIDPPPPPDEPAYLSVKYHRVTVTIEDQVATTHVDQVFINESREEREGVYVFPLPEGAAIDDFAMWVDGERLGGEMLPADEARRIYEDIVRRRRDPALLEYVGRDTFRARIFPIPPRSEKRVEIEYREIIPLDGGLIRYRYPLDTERFSPRPIGDVSVRVEVHSREAIKAIYSPSHEIDIERGGDHRFVAGYEDVNVRPDTDFELYYTVAEEDIGLNLLSYMGNDGDGFYVMLLAPQVEVEQAEVVTRDVILVLDTSGSMRGEKLAQAQKALSYVLDQLHDEDRFNVVAFSTGVRAFDRQVVPATTGARARARRWVDELEAKGGTNIHRALLDALSQLASSSLGDVERPAIVVFLTDGLATEGVVQSADILRDVDDAAPAAARLFTFGVGDDVHTVLLDLLAREHRGASAYVRPGQRIDEIVSSFYAKVSTPLLSDLQIDFGNVHVEDSYPYPLPDLFAGTQIVMAGRYRTGGDTTVTLRGTVNGERRAFEFGDVHFETGEGARTHASFIPRLWATRKVGYLLNQIRLHGESRELVEEIVDLSVRYGIMTPYTAFLVEEDAEVFSREGRRLTVEREYNTRAAEAPAAPSGKAAVDEAERQMALEGSDTATGATGEVVKVVGDKVFLLREGVWTDTAFDVELMRPVKVGFISAEYFRLAAARPEWGAYLSVGERVLVVLPGVDGPTAYLVVEQDAGEPIRLPPTRTPVTQTRTPVTRTPVTQTRTPVTQTPVTQTAATQTSIATPTAGATPLPAATGTVAPAPLARGAGFCRGAAAAVMLALVGVLPFAWRR